MPAGSSVAYTVTCTIDPAATGTLSNTATANGSVPDPDPTNNAATDDDTVLANLHVQKDPDLQTIDPGSTATFTITVGNTGSATLTDVRVTDPAAPDCDQDIGTLLPGAEVSYTCGVDDVAAAFVNIATASALAPGDVAIESSDDAAVAIRMPGVTIRKLPDFQSVAAGGTAEFAIVVENSGRGTLTNVVVTDALSPDCDATFATLGEGEVESYQCELTGVTGSFVNTARVTAVDESGEQVTDSDDATVAVPAGLEIVKSPDSQVVVPGGTAAFTITVLNSGSTTLSDVTVSDPLSPDCARVIGNLAPDTAVGYDCSRGGLTEGFVNVATVTARDEAVTLDASDDAAVEVSDPSIAIAKTPDVQRVVLGGTASFDITVTNTGLFDLDGVVVDDTLAPDCSRSIGPLAAGAFLSYSCSFGPVTAGFTNEATVSAAAGTTAVDAVASAEVVAVRADLDITKTPDLQVIDHGDTAAFTITVSNVGAGVISDIVVADPAVPACDRVIGTLAPGDSVSFDCSLANVTESFLNVATVTGNGGAGELGNHEEDTAEVIVRGPYIDIQKNPASQVVSPGETATFSITVTNTGDDTLTDVSVSDPQVPDCDADIGSMAEGESITYTCELTAVTSAFVNVATVSATDPAGDLVSDTDDAHVAVTGPALAITKSPDPQTVLAGNTATWTITVRNTGDEVLTEVDVADPLAPGCERDIGDLDLHDSVSYSCSLDDVQDSFTNVATVTGEDAGGGTVGDTSDAFVFVPTCDGEPVTIMGSNGDDVIFGTEGDDVIWGRAGDDRIFGLGGNDTICGDQGDDWIAGNAGDDRIHGGAGIDTGDYSDAPGAVSVNLGIDSATGADGTDVVATVENVIGSAFDDELRGDAGDNALWGGAGDDTLNGNKGDDTLLGQAGNDWLNGGLGDDFMSGAGGQDWGVYITSPIGVRVDLRIFGPQITRYGRDTLLNIEHLIGSNKNDVLGGNNKANQLLGRKGRDFLLGRAGDDLLIGNAGIDAAFGASGTDTCSAEVTVNCEL